MERKSVDHLILQERLTAWHQPRCFMMQPSSCCRPDLSATHAEFVLISFRRLSCFLTCRAWSTAHYGGNVIIIQTSAGTLNELVNGL